MPATLSEVELEAYASASGDKIVIETLSFYYDGLVNDNDEPAEFYLFNGDNAASVTEDGVPLLPARIEAGADRNAGSVVVFQGRPFTLTPAPMNTDGVVLGALQVDSVGREMHDLLSAAAKGGKAIYVTFRRYHHGHELDGPLDLPPQVFFLQSAFGDNDSVSGQLAFIAIGNRAYPEDAYRPVPFTTLQWA